jgi:hypothetical protein
MESGIGILPFLQGQAWPIFKSGDRTDHQRSPPLSKILKISGYAPARPGEPLKLLLFSIGEDPRACQKSFMFDESSLLIFFKGYSQFLLGVHNNRAIPGHRLLNGFSRNE